jgi:hypothetical protein
VLLTRIVKKRFLPFLVMAGISAGCSAACARVRLRPLGAGALVMGASGTATLATATSGTATSGTAGLVEAGLALAGRPGFLLTGSSLAVAEVSTCC